MQPVFLSLGRALGRERRHSPASAGITVPARKADRNTSVCKASAMMLIMGIVTLCGGCKAGGRGRVLFRQRRQYEHSRERNLGCTMYIQKGGQGSFLMTPPPSWGPLVPQ